jgi:hypothetical protein
MGVSLFVWPTAAFLFPLVAAETLSLEAGRRGLLNSLALLALGMALATVLILIPVWASAPAAARDFVSFSAGVVRFDLVSNPLTLGRILFLANPILLFLLIPAMVTVNRWALIAFLLALLGVLSSSTYTHRAVYLLPYLYSLLAQCGSKFYWSTTKLHRVLVVSAGALLLWSGTISLVARTELAMIQRESRNPAVLLAESAGIHASSGSLVFLPWEFYYAGRRLGWHMYIPYATYSENQLRSLYGRMDYAIYPFETVTPELRTTLGESGLRASRILLPQKSDPLSIAGYPIRWGAKGYGPYEVFSRR